MTLSSISIRNNAGGTTILSAVTMSDGSQAPAHVFIDANGALVGTASNPFQTAPAIKAAVPSDCGGQIVTALADIPLLAADPARAGGWIQADPNNTGLIKVRFVLGSTTYQTSLAAGAAFSMTINGLVIQTPIVVAGTVPGDLFAGGVFH